MKDQDFEKVIRDISNCLPEADRLSETAIHFMTILLRRSVETAASVGVDEALFRVGLSTRPAAPQSDTSPDKA